MENDLKYSLSIKKIIVQSFVFLFFLNMISLIILIFIDAKLVDSRKKEIISKEKTLMDLEQKILLSDLQKVMSDLHFLEEIIVYSVEHDINKTDIERLWISFSRHSNLYYQIRFIDKSGNEIIKVQNDGDKAFLIPKNELQNKKNKNYFINSLKLGRNQHFISKLDLNMENGEVEKPIKPMLRFTSKIYIDDKFYGLIVLNYLADNVLNEFEDAAKESFGKLFLINSDGYWIIGGSKLENWAFMYKERKHINFRRIYPLVWRRILKGDTNFIENELLINWQELNVSKIYKNYTKDHLIFVDNRFRIVSVIDRNDDVDSIFFENTFETIKRIFRENFIIFVFISLLALMFEMIIVISVKSYLKIKYNSEHDSLTDTLNRKSGFDILEKYIKNKEIDSKSQLSVCFIDINGLKQVNDILGHKAGDELILTVIEVIKNTIRRKDHIVRFGGDEFLIIFVGIREAEADKVWRRINEKFERINKLENRKYIISVSHGVVDSIGIDGEILEKIVKKADERMYEEKKLIKNKMKNYIKN